MDKNNLLGLLLMGAVIFGFMYINQPSEEEIAAAKKAQIESPASVASLICGIAFPKVQ